MNISNIRKLRKMVMSIISISDCKMALIEENDVQKAFEKLKIDKTKQIIHTTGASVEVAYKWLVRYQGNVDNAIKAIEYVS